MIEYKILEQLDENLKGTWLKLFSQCFSTDLSAAEKIYRKYELNNCKFCLVYSGSDLVASYSGLCVVASNNLKLFISTDTMSSGQVRGGSILAAEKLYRHLVLLGFDSVCGYPNKNILGLRLSKLNWKVLKETNLYLRFLPRPFAVTSSVQGPNFHINRPIEGFFGRQPLGLKLANYNRKFGFFEIRISSVPIGFGFANISNLIPSTRKYFCYKVLKTGKEKEIVRALNALILDETSIDVP